MKWGMQGACVLVGAQITFDHASRASNMGCAGGQVERRLPRPPTAACIHLPLLPQTIIHMMHHGPDTSPPARHLCRAHRLLAVLVGLPGAGKTTAATHLAATGAAHDGVWWVRVDTGDDVAQQVDPAASRSLTTICPCVLRVLCAPLGCSCGAPPLPGCAAGCRHQHQQLQQRRLEGRCAPQVCSFGSSGMTLPVLACQEWSSSAHTHTPPEYNLCVPRSCGAGVPAAACEAGGAAAATTAAAAAARAGAGGRQQSVPKHAAAAAATCPHA